MPQHVATRGKHSARFFTPEGRLCSTARRLHPMPLDWVLHEKYQLPAEEVGGGCGAGVLSGWLERWLYRAVLAGCTCAVLHGGMAERMRVPPCHLSRRRRALSGHACRPIPAAFHPLPIPLCLHCRPRPCATS